MVSTDSRTRVAFFIPSMDTGGAERVTLNLIRALSTDDTLRIDLVLCHARGGYLDQVPDSVNVVDLKVSRIATSLVPLARWLRAEKPDVLLSALVTANIIASFAALVARFSGRLILAEHNDFATALSSATNRRAQIAPALIRRAYPRADRVIAVSEGVARGLSESVGLKPDLIAVVPNPVINDEVKEKVNGTADHPWFNDGEGPVALAVGRLQQQKNFPLLIDAMAHMDRHHNLRLVIHGDGPDRAALQEQIEKNDLADTISLGGLTSNPYAAMRAADMLVMSSSFEGLPTVLIEGLFCGTAVISTDCPSGPHEILNGGTFGTLVPMNDAHRLAEAMSNEIVSPRDPNPPESWSPYTEHVVISKYRAVLGL